MEGLAKHISTPVLRKGETVGQGGGKHRRPRPCEGHPRSESKPWRLIMSGQGGETLDTLGVDG